MRRLILTLLVIGAILFGACTQAPPTITTPPTPTSPSAVPTTPAPTSPGAAAQLQVHFINVGQGDAILVDHGTTEVLIDGGDRSPGVVPYLRKYVDGDLEAMVATHPHADHIGGLIDVLQTFQVDKIYWNGETADTKTYSDFMAAAKAEPQSSLQQLKRGDSISVNGLIFPVLNPPSPLFKDINNNSIVLKLKQGDIQFLFEGDAEQEAESSMLAAGLNVDADILKVGHHGSRSSSSMPFLGAVSPQVAVYMAGINNSYGHPHAETITALNQVGARVYGTDLHGTVIVTIDGQKYTLKLEKDASPRAPPAIATFTTTDLSITPAEVNIGEIVTISVVVTNAGSATGTYPVTLKINGMPTQTKSVTLAGGASQKVTFTTSNNVAGTYAVGIDSLSGTFKVMAASASFTVSALTMSPTEVNIGQSVTITVDVTNTGDLGGTYEVILKVDNVVVSTKQVTLAGHASQKVTFTTAKEAAGVYAVNVGGLSGTFTVKSAPTPPATELTLEIVSVTSPVGPGYNATLVAKATPGAECDITVYYKSGPSTAQGLYPKTADANGNVSWTWKVGTRTTPGSWRIVVTASLGGKTISQTTYFTVQ